LISKQLTIFPLPRTHVNQKKKRNYK